MKKIISAFFLTAVFAAGLVLSANNTASAARPPKPCDTCPPGWFCHENKKTGEILCYCRNCGGW